MTIDATDRHLIGLLKDNARAPVSELARRLGVSRTTVQSRIERLERRRLIAGYTVRLSDDYEAALIRAHIMISVRSKATPEVEAALQRIPEIRTVHAVAGTFDMIVIGVTPSVREMDDLIDKIGGIEGVERTTSSIVLSTRLDR